MLEAKIDIELKGEIVKPIVIAGDSKPLVETPTSQQLVELLG